jgi:hypothetical protein
MFTKHVITKLNNQTITQGYILGVGLPATAQQLNQHNIPYIEKNSLTAMTCQTKGFHLIRNKLLLVDDVFTGTMPYFAPINTLLTENQLYGPRPNNAAAIPISDITGEYFNNCLDKLSSSLSDTIGEFYGSRNIRMILPDEYEDSEQLNQLFGVYSLIVW